jgi:hypothetical protein
MWHDVVVIWQLVDDVAVDNWWMMLRWRRRPDRGDYGSGQTGCHDQTRIATSLWQR